MESADDNLDEVVDALMESREKAFRKAQEKILKAQNGNKKRHMTENI